MQASTPEGDDAIESEDPKHIAEANTVTETPSEPEPEAEAESQMAEVMEDITSVS